jgi:MOSC domain-containing protein YiiM
MEAIVTAVSRSRRHSFSKEPESLIQLVAGLGVEGDAHSGVTVRHRSHVRVDPTRPNLRQVHLIHSELHDELNAAGFDVGSGDLGENVTTRGIALLDLPAGARLHLGDQAIVAVTGLRNPCIQLDRFQPGLMKAVLERDAAGKLIRKSGVMAIVIRGGAVRAGDAIRVELPEGERKPLSVV